LLKQNQKIKQKSHEWTIKNLHLWFLNFVIFITTFLWVLKSELSNSSIDWADNNLSYHQLFLKKQLLAESCFCCHWSLIQTTISESSINQSIESWACWLFSNVSFYESHWVNLIIWMTVSLTQNLIILSRTYNHLLNFFLLIFFSLFCFSHFHSYEANCLTFE